MNYLEYAICHSVSWYNWIVTHVLWCVSYCEVLTNTQPYLSILTDKLILFLSLQLWQAQKIKQVSRFLSFIHFLSASKNDTHTHTHTHTHTLLPHLNHHNWMHHCLYYLWLLWHVWCQCIGKQNTSLHTLPKHFAVSNKHPTEWTKTLIAKFLPWNDKDSEAGK